MYQFLEMVVKNTRACSVVLSCPSHYNPVDCSLPGPVHGLFQEYWSGLPVPTPGNLPNPESNPTLFCLHWQADSLPLHHLGSPIKNMDDFLNDLFQK